MTIGERIRNRREEVGMSQQDLANKLGYKSKVSISKIESGVRELRQKNIMDIAKALRTTPAYIMGWDDEKETSSTDAELVNLFATLTDDQKHQVAKFIAFIQHEKESE